MKLFRLKPIHKKEPTAKHVPVKPAHHSQQKTETKELLSPLSLGLLRFGLTCTLLAAVAALGIAVTNRTAEGWHLWNNMAGVAMKFLLFTLLAVIITDRPDTQK